jgi:hypothetical protein
MSSNILHQLGLDEPLMDKGSHKAPVEDPSTVEPEAEAPIVHIEGARFSYGRQIILESGRGKLP